MRTVLKRAACLLLSLLLPLTVALADDGQDAAVEKLDRSETVYVTATASGEVSSVLSSVYIVNPDGRAEISDTARLTDVHNVLANDNPVQSGDTYTFHADGDDVCYQGVSTDELPFAMQVTYALDGKPIEPEALAGKSGRVDITITYENRLLNDVALGDETITLYTPLNIVTIIALNDGFSNVHCTNAHILTDAGSVSVIGMTFPGLAHNLDTEEEDELSPSLYFTADVENFELDSIMAVIMPDLFDSDDLERIDELRDFVDGVDTLAEAADELASGGASLSYGLGKLADAMEEFSTGLDTAVSAMDDGYASAAQSVQTMQQSLNTALDGAIAAIDRIQLSGASTAAEAVVAQLADQGFTPKQLEAVKTVVAGVWTQQNAALTAQLGGLKAILQQLKSGLSGLGSLLAFGDAIDGMQLLADAAVEIADGLASSASGARSLSRGLKEFNEDGMGELQENTEGIALALDRKDAMLDLAEAYTSFSGDSNASSGSVRFIVTTDSIYMPKVSPAPTPDPDAETEETSGFFARVWDWITGLFGG